LSYDEVGGGGSQGATAALDSVLLEMLKDIRKQVGKTHSVPPFVVFSENIE
jgi:ATP-dependent DNA helicase RecQ